MEVTQILVDAGAVERPPGSMGVVWQDQGDVTLKRNHRIVLVGRALADIAAGMRVDVGKHAKSAALAELPQGGVERAEAKKAACLSKADIYLKA